MDTVILKLFCVYGSIEHMIKYTDVGGNKSSHL